MEVYKDLSSLTNEDLILLKEDTEKSIARYNNLQQAQKILLNGGYGSLSNEFNRWYSDDIAESITLSGQLSARWIINHINKFFNNLYKTTDIDYVIACDTDSIHLNVAPAIIKAFGNTPPNHEEKMAFLENFAARIEQEIKVGYDLLAEEMNVFESAMHMKLETISRAVWTGKKHYIMEVWANEGIRYNPPKSKIVGMEAVKSSTPKIIRQWMMEIYPLILDLKSDEIINTLDQKRAEYDLLDFEEIASPRGITDITKYLSYGKGYADGCPIHVRAAILYNKQLMEKHLDTIYHPIQNGDKIKYCYMKLPNPINENVFAVVDSLPPEFGLGEYVDRELQFNKTFADPIRNIVRAAGISLSLDYNIEDFFGISAEPQTPSAYQDDPEDEDSTEIQITIRIPHG